MSKYLIKYCSDVGILPSAFVPGKMYHRIYIRLNTPSYYGNGQPVGFVSNEQGVKYQIDMREVIKATGYDIYKRSYTHSSIDPYSSVYIHPQEISGCMTLKQAKAIADVIADSDSPSEVTGIDVYACRELIPLAEVLKRVEFYRQEIIDIILEGFQSPNKRRFLPKDRMQKWTELRGLSLYNERIIGEGYLSPFLQANSAVDGILMQLIEEGRIICHPEFPEYFRSANKRELALANRVLKQKSLAY